MSFLLNIIGGTQTAPITGTRTINLLDTFRGNAPSSVFPLARQDFSKSWDTEADFVAAHPGAVNTGPGVYEIPAATSSSETIYTLRAPLTNGVVRTVTSSTNGTNSGELRGELAAAQPGDTIQIQPGLVVQISTKLTIAETDITIKGPGTIQGKEVELTNCTRVHIDNVRFYAGVTGNTADSLAIRTGNQDISITRCTVAFAADETISALESNRIFYGRCMSGFSLVNSGTGNAMNQLIVDCSDVIAHKCFFNNSTSRPEISSDSENVDRIEFVNNIYSNVSFNWMTWTGNASGSTQMRDVYAYNNLIIEGIDASGTSWKNIRSRHDVHHFHLNNDCVANFGTVTIEPAVISHEATDPIQPVASQVFTKNPSLQTDAVPFDWADVGTTDHDLVELKMIDLAVNGGGVGAIEPATGLPYVPPTWLIVTEEQTGYPLI